MNREAPAPAAEAVPSDTPEAASGRRPWRAPQFMMTEIALTDNMSGGTIDPGFFGS